jgi:hypothetical protein
MPMAPSPMPVEMETMVSFSYISRETFYIV